MPTQTGTPQPRATLVLVNRALEPFNLKSGLNGAGPDWVVTAMRSDPRWHAVSVRTGRTRTLCWIPATYPLLDASSEVDDQFIADLSVDLVCLRNSLADSGGKPPPLPERPADPKPSKPKRVTKRALAVLKAPLGREGAAAMKRATQLLASKDAMKRASLESLLVAALASGDRRLVDAAVRRAEAMVADDEMFLGLNAFSPLGKLLEHRDATVQKRFAALKKVLPARLRRHFKNEL